MRANTISVLLPLHGLQRSSLMTGVSTSAAQDGPRLPTALRPLGWVEDVLAWLLAHPLLTLQIVLFWLISWGGLGADLGLDDLFWHESATVQFAVGISVGLLFAQVLFIRYLVDTRRRSGKPPS